ncbi:hypothetical protein GA830_05840 [Mesorhizobium sp. NBSH29]|uniref:hypothetical protein n=1 Tax=Mesorhizobium sp. NBSH29 TaxID=2654249 RepID=UPI0018967D16|nr:hypothetical protein [Mesorhizobium sp. NBSH29]QPC86313.1 hypothetical protein GA830_05840 [Mesorhizobium sp. NBSH29]
MGGRRRNIGSAVLGAGVMLPAEALAHASDRGHVLLLPTGTYLIGGAVAVAASFAGLALLSPDSVERLARQRVGLVAAPLRWRLTTSMGSFLVMVILIATGLWGSRDPLSNPLPLVVWTLFWVGLTLVQGIFGNVWAWINPWTGPVWLLRKISGFSGHGRRLPFSIGTWPAVLLLFCFAWFELVDPAPDDPARLAKAVTLYWLFNTAMMLLFGTRAWMRRGEALSVFFTMIARLSLFCARPGRFISVGWPAGKLVSAPVLPLSGVVFLLLALAAVSFDGTSKTFFWLGANGINPLEFPGRSALMTTNTIGLAAFAMCFTVLYLGAVSAGAMLAGTLSNWKRDAGQLVWSMAPIALAYHFAHYITLLAVNSQYALVAISDPFALGWDLFGTAYAQVSPGIIAGAESARVLWNLQAGAIIVGHVLAVFAAHLLACRNGDTQSRITRRLLPLTVLMIGYTVFGLWLLSTPTAG